MAASGLVTICRESHNESMTRVFVTQTKYDEDSGDKHDGDNDRDNNQDVNEDDSASANDDSAGGCNSCRVLCIHGQLNKLFCAVVLVWFRV